MKNLWPKKKPKVKIKSMDWSMETIKLFLKGKLTLQRN